MVICCFGIIRFNRYHIYWYAGIAVFFFSLNVIQNYICKTFCNYKGDVTSYFLGYDHVTPATNPGRLFTVFFGLVGIPLMFITAADIGKFLSEIVIRSYSKLFELFERIGSMIDAIRDCVKDDDDSIVSRLDSLLSPHFSALCGIPLMFIKLNYTKSFFE